MLRSGRLDDLEVIRDRVRRGIGGHLSGVVAACREPATLLVPASLGLPRTIQHDKAGRLTVIGGMRDDGAMAALCRRGKVPEFRPKKRAGGEEAEAGISRNG